MKKTLTINLNGMVFHIDEDAYHLLDDYIKSIRAYLKEVSGKDEIIEDIEARISEIMHTRISAFNQVITETDVRGVIAQIGQPEDFSIESEEGSPNHKDTVEEKVEDGDMDAEDSSEAESEKVFFKKLFRDVDNKLLGGVISGLSCYFKIEILPLRLIAIILLFASAGTVILAYLIAWIIIPPAITVLDKMMMRGEPIDVDSIGRKFSDGYSEEPFSKKKSSVLTKLVSIFAFLLKTIAFIILLILSPILIIVVLALFVALFAVLSSVILGTSLLATLPGSWPIFSLVAALFLVAIPLVSLVYAVFGKIFNYPGIKTSFRWILLILWVLSLIVFYYTLAQYGLGNVHYIIDQFNSFAMLR